MIFYALFWLCILTTLWMLIKRISPWFSTLIFCFSISSMILTSYSILIPTVVDYEKYEIIDCKKDLFSLKLKSGLSGTFSLGSGYISGNQYYHYYTKDADEFYIMNSTRADRSRIKEIGGTEKPYISYQVVKSRVPRFWLPFGDSIETTTLVDFFIPENSIVVEYNPN